jgi:hypothetical protein
VTDLTAAHPDILPAVAAIHRAAMALMDQDDAEIAAIGHVLHAWLDAPRDEAASAQTDLGLGADWRVARRRAERNRALLALRDRHFASLVGRSAAAAVAGALTRYRGTSWPRDRKAARRPDGLRGELFDVLCWGGIPSDRILQSLFKALPAQQSDDVSAQLIRQSA